jgi:hypothetical protein
MPADEDAIRQVPAGAWKPGTAQDGTAEEDKDTAEITGLMTRAGNWPEGLRWIARRVKPSRRHLHNLTDYEKKAGWKYSITCTNIPDDGIGGVPGSHHPQYIDVLHREHATVETAGVRTAKAMGLRNLQDLAGQRRLGPRREHRRRPRRLDPAPRPQRRRGTRERRPGHAPLPDRAPARQARPPRTPAGTRNQRRLALGTRVPRLLAAAPRIASTRLTTTNSPYDKKEDHPGAVGAGAHPGTPGAPRTTRPEDKRTRSRKTDTGTFSNQTSSRLND